MTLQFVIHGPDAGTLQQQKQSPSESITMTGRVKALRRVLDH